MFSVILLSSWNETFISLELYRSQHTSVLSSTLAWQWICFRLLWMSLAAFFSKKEFDKKFSTRWHWVTILPSISHTRKKFTTFLSSGVGILSCSLNMGNLDQILTSANIIHSFTCVFHTLNNRRSEFCQDTKAHATHLRLLKSCKIVSSLGD